MSALPAWLQKWVTEGCDFKNLPYEKGRHEKWPPATEVLEEFKKLYLDLQPTVRKTVGVFPPSKQGVLSTRSFWERTMHGSRYGIFILVALLAVCRRYSKNVADRKALDVAMEELAWILEQMNIVMECNGEKNGGKRSLQPEADVARKRCINFVVTRIIRIVSC